MGCCWQRKSLPVAVLLSVNQPYSGLSLMGYCWLSMRLSVTVLLFMSAEKELMRCCLRLGEKTL